MEQGLINWLTIENDGFPKKQNALRSVKVLTWVSGPNPWPIINYWNYITNEWEANEKNGIPFPITHYAYYNEPK